MKKYLMLMLLFSCCLSCFGQTQSTSKDQAIAGKLRDSLGLNTSQYDAVLGITTNVNSYRMQLVQTYAYGDSLKLKTYRIERTRDSLYKTVLSTNQYHTYIRRKDAWLN
jgi:hypothetical protein